MDPAGTGPTRRQSSRQRLDGESAVLLQPRRPIRDDQTGRRQQLRPDPSPLDPAPRRSLRVQRNPVTSLDRAPATPLLPARAHRLSVSPRRTRVHPGSPVSGSTHLAQRWAPLPGYWTHAIRTEAAVGSPGVGADRAGVRGSLTHELRLRRDRHGVLSGNHGARVSECLSSPGECAWRFWLAREAFAAPDLRNRRRRSSQHLPCSCCPSWDSASCWSQSGKELASDGVECGAVRACSPLSHPSRTVVFQHRECGPARLALPLCPPRRARG
jgi:hypothetical protein